MERYSYPEIIWFQEPEVVISLFEHGDITDVMSWYDMTEEQAEELLRFVINR